MNYDNKLMQRKLADDYVAGLMCTAASRRFEKLMLQNAELKQAVKHTQYQWSRMLTFLTPETVPQRVWQRIEQRLFAERQNTIAITRQSKAVNQWWLTTWATAASVAAVFLGAWLWMASPTSLSQQNLVAVVNNAQQQPSWIISVDKNSGKVTAKAMTVASLSKDKDYELWLIKGNEKPHSMGILPKSGKQQMHYTPQQFADLAANVTLAVTVEAKGGSKTGQPTSKPQYLGKMVSLS